MSGREDAYVDYHSFSPSLGSFSYSRQSRIQSTQQDYSYRIEEMQRQQEREFRQRLQPIEERQQRFESSIKNLSSNVGQLEREMIQRDRSMQQHLQQQHHEFTSRLQQQRNETQRQFEHQRMEYRQLVHEQDLRMTRLIEEERQQRVQAVNNLQQQINQITADAVRKEKIATAFVADLTKVLKETGKLPHERFASGQLELVQRHIRDASSSLDAGIPEAALSTAQDAYWQLADLRSLVLQKESEFIMLHQAALEEVRTILEEARAHRECEINPESPADGEKIKLEVDYWSKGKLTALEKELQAIEHRLVSEEKSLNADDVRNILISLEEAEPKIIEIINGARDSIIDSHLRFNTAEMVVNALTAQGFDVVEGVYEGNDQRNAYVAKVRNIADTEIVTVISPVPDSAGKCRVSIHSYDETFVGEETLRERAREVAHLLEKEGLQVAPPACMGNADQSYRDFAAVAARQPGTAQRRSERTIH